MVKKTRNKSLLFIVFSFLIYVFITAIIFYHRFPNIFTQYGMPDVDTDGGLWYQWYLTYIHKHHLLYDITALAGYPLGYDISLSPANNLIYNIQVFFLEHIFGFSWSNLVLITNVSSLITYP